jgi:hypothetical protein
LEFTDDPIAVIVMGTGDESADGGKYDNCCLHSCAPLTL